MFDRTRRTGYRVLSVLNDANAISRGPKAVAKRYVRKRAWRAFGGFMSSVLGGRR